VRCARRPAMGRRPIAVRVPRGKMTCSPHFVWFVDNVALRRDIEASPRTRCRARSIPQSRTRLRTQSQETLSRRELNSVRNSMRAAYREGRIS
jgi:hypothetical protein